MGDGGQMGSIETRDDPAAGVCLLELAVVRGTEPHVATRLFSPPVRHRDGFVVEGHRYERLLSFQLGDPGARTLAASMSGTLQAPFPSTTSVSLATIATGLPPSKHGQVAHLTWMPDVGKVVNSLKWVTTTGEPVPYGYSSVLPSPNLWERLRAAGVEPITVQPGDFSGSPLSRVLYRGARFEGAWDEEDLVTATVQLASEPRRLIFTYVPLSTNRENWVVAPL